MAVDKKTTFLSENTALDSTRQKEFNQKITKLKKTKREPRGVVYIGHIPRGFTEPEMTEYFKQFGNINKLRLARSKKTGNPKGYAFIEFQSESVAKIVADTMNNYLMFHKLLKCHLIDSSKIHPELFKGANRTFTMPKAHKTAASRHNRTKSAKQKSCALRSMKTKKAKTLAKLTELGINFQYPTLLHTKRQKAEGGLKASLDKTEEEEEQKEKEEEETDFAPEDLPAEAYAVLYDDSDEDEISFITPPKSRRKSLSKSLLENSLHLPLMESPTPADGLKNMAKKRLEKKLKIKSKRVECKRNQIQEGGWL